jgi:hypothetical protein
VDQKLHDIATSGPVVLSPDLSKLKVVGLTREMAESYVPMNITVSYAGQDGTQAILDDHRMDKGRKEVEDSLRDHLAGAAITGRQRLAESGLSPFPKENTACPRFLRKAVWSP